MAQPFEYGPGSLREAQPLLYEHQNHYVHTQRGCACLKLTGPYSKGWAILTKLRHTRVWRSRLGNTQNLGTSEFPKVFQNPLYCARLTLGLSTKHGYNNQQYRERTTGKEPRVFKEAIE